MSTCLRNCVTHNTGRTTCSWTNQLTWNFKVWLRLSKAITPNERLMATLRYLATGRTLEDLKFSCRIAPQTLGKIIPDTCEAIFKALRNYCKCPTTEKEWENVAGKFEHRWNFPNCIGTVDGNHAAFRIWIRNFHSQVLLGTASANDVLLYFSFGRNGRGSDGGVFEASDLSEKLEDGSLNFPKEGTITATNL
ncbi:hypothetical protein PR048_010102 [Dryococelus australis]|uniref:DDE Tnp4 domain-containing protein n=1 Tax=Dryococelus australis TaxID=614101 RepID=A0ABQ9I1S9_9NEOP|nr:hypothetical protein PR048_010102 [Dryococelus australis]